MPTRREILKLLGLSTAAALCMPFGGWAALSLPPIEERVFYGSEGSEEPLPLTSTQRYRLLDALRSLDPGKGPLPHNSRWVCAFALPPSCRRYGPPFCGVASVSQPELYFFDSDFEELLISIRSFPSDTEAEFLKRRDQREAVQQRGLPIC